MKHWPVLASYALKQQRLRPSRQVSGITEAPVRFVVRVLRTRLGPREAISGSQSSARCIRLDLLSLVSPEHQIKRRSKGERLVLTVWRYSGVRYVDLLAAIFKSSVCTLTTRSKSCLSNRTEALPQEFKGPPNGTLVHYT